MRKLPLLLAGMLALFAGQASAAPFVFSDFSDVGPLTLNGNAVQNGNVLRLTSANFFQSGTAFTDAAIPLDAAYSFSTFFSFQITGSGGIGDADGAGADGITFIVQTNNNNAGSSGGGIGYELIPNSMAVEFDTYDNGGIDDNNGNHVGVDTGGSVDSLGTVTPVPGRFNDGSVWFSWVDYNGATDTLEVRVANTNARPATALLTRVLDLNAALGASGSAFVGFGAATGSGYGNHDILSWEFRDQFSPIASDPSPVPEPATVGLLAIGLTGLVIARRRSRS